MTDEKRSARGGAAGAACWTRRRALWMGAGAGLIGLLGGVALGGAEPASAGRWLHRHGHAGHHGGWHGERLRRGVERVLEEVEASDAQRARVDAIVAELSTNLAGLRQAHAAHHEALVEALSDDPVDRDRVEEIRGEGLGLVEEASEEILTALVEVAEVLTAEQRAALAELHGRHSHR